MIDTVFLRCENLSRSFQAAGREVQALKGINLEVQAGESVAVVGPSGAGKSTLLHICGALDAPDGGQVFLEGQDLYGLKPKQQALLRAGKMGFVFQDHHLLPEFSALENMLLAWLVAGKPAGEGKKRAAQLLELMGLKDRMDHRPAQLSGGERQRVAVGRAMMNSPALLLADEPTGNLDEETGMRVFNQFLDLQKEAGSALVVVTHSRALAERCDRVLTLREGSWETA